MTLWYFLLFWHAVRLKWDQSYLIYPVLILSIWISYLFYDYFAIPTETKWRFTLRMHLLLMLISGITVLYVYLSTDLIMEDQLSLAAKKLFLLSGWLVLINAGRVLIREIVIEISIDTNTFVFIDGLLTYLLTLGIIIPVSIFVLKYPQAVLLSHDQKELCKEVLAASFSPSTE